MHEMLELRAKINYLFMSFGIAVILISLVGAPVYAQLFGCDPKAIECAKKQGAIDAVSDMVEGGIQGSTIGGRSLFSKL